MDDHHYQFLTSFITIGLGYVCTATGVLSREDAAPIARLLFGLLVPMLLLGSMTRMEIKAEYLLFVGLHGGYTVVSLLLAFVANSRVSDGELRGMLTMASFGNSLPFSLPLIESVWGTDGVLLAFLFDLPNVLAIFGVTPLLAHQYSPLVQVPAGPVVAAPTEPTTKEECDEQQNELQQAVPSESVESAPASVAVEADEVEVSSNCGVMRSSPTRLPIPAALTTYCSARLAVSLLKNQPFMSVLIAVTLNISTIGAPDYAITVCKSMGVAVTPMILILSGVHDCLAAEKVQLNC